MKHLLTAVLCALTMLGSVYAQDPNMGDQRLEPQKIKEVPGSKIDHKGFMLNPLPREMKVDGKHRTLDIVKKPLHITATHGSKAAEAAGVEPRTGAYSLKIDKKGATIVGYDKTGEHYGRKTLEQILASPVARQGKVPFLEINDYPEIEFRGLVEGFYGTPWSHDKRLMLMKVLGDNKMNTYVYGPKDDRYHRSAGWRLPYPAYEASKIKELINAARENYVQFTWAVHPGGDITWSDDDFADLISKFEQLYNLGCRSFAIFFDDIEGEGTDPAKQVAFLNRVCSEFIDTKGDVAPLVMCPTDYTRAWANGSDDGALAIYGRTLNPDVKVMWTGDFVCADIPASTLEWVSERTRRAPFVWWNYPVTDYCRNLVLQGPVYGLDPSNNASTLAGFVSNPMEHAAASALALFSVADYTWNPAGYNPLDAWERSLGAMMPECAEEYRTFAINNCDTKIGYRRAESWDSEVETLATLTPAKVDILLAKLAKMQEAPTVIRRKASNRALVDELDPWLTEMEALAERTTEAINLAMRRDNLAPIELWLEYAKVRMDTSEVSAYNAHSVGTLVWQPTYENIMKGIGNELLGSLASYGSADAVRNFPVVENDSTRLAAIDGDLTTSYPFKGHTKLTIPAGVKQVTLLLGAMEPDAAIEVVQTASNGTPTATCAVMRPIYTIDIVPRTTRLQLYGTGEIVEILPHY